MGKAWEISSHTFSIVWVLFSIRFPSCGIPHHMRNAWVSPSISHSIGKCSEIHWIERAWEIGNHTFPKVWVLFSIRFPSYVISYPMENAWLFPSISHSINSRHAGTKSKIYQKKKRAWILFHQKRGIQTLDKSILPYTKLSLLLTITSKNYNSYPKTSTKSAATVTFFIRFYYHVMLWLFCFKNFCLSFAGTVILNSLTL